MLVATLSAVAGQCSAAVCAAAFSGMMVLVVAAGVTMRRNPGADEAHRNTDGATVIEGAHATLRLLDLVVALAGGACAVLAVQIGLSGNLPAAMVPAALTVGLGTYLEQRVRGRVATGNLGITAAGVGQRGWTFTSYLAWDDIVGVTASYGTFREILLVGRPDSDWHAAPTTRIWRIDRLPPVPMIQVDCSRYRVDSSALLDFVRYYLENPDARSELGTRAASSRLNTQ